jgi:hypothetical protein
VPLNSAPSAYSPLDKSSKLPMLLHALLKEHDKPKSKHALKKNLGDAYLLAHNPIYARVRDAILKAGFKFSSERFYHYDALPLIELPRILAKKIIPYQDNVSPLKEIEAKAKGVFDLTFVTGLKLNYLLHESAHGIARAITKKTLGKHRAKSGLKFEQEIVLRTQIEEAFANTTECMANLYVKDTSGKDSVHPHEEFFQRNAYIFKSVASQELLIVSDSNYGFEITTRLIFFSYLYSNMIKTEMAVDHFDRVLALVYRDDLETFQRLSDDDKAFLERIFGLGLGLDQQFTVFTNTLCLRLMGLKHEIFDLIAFDFLAVIEKEPRYLACLAKMVTVLS